VTGTDPLLVKGSLQSGLLALFFITIEMKYFAKVELNRFNVFLVEEVYIQKI